MGVDRNAERNQILRRISNNYEASLKKKSASKVQIIPIIISIMALIASIAIPLYLYRVELVNKPLLLEKNIEIVKNSGEEQKLHIKMDIKQGGIQKVYFAEVLSANEIIYENILGTSNEKSVEFDILTHKKTDDRAPSDIDNTYESSMNVTIKSINDFALVFLDTTGQWWVYYIVSSPEISIENAQYHFEVQDEKGKVIVSTEEDIEKQEMEYILIDGTLTSTMSIENTLSKLDTDYHLFKSPKTFEGKDGVKFTSNPVIKNIYELPQAEDVFDNIMKIHEDINNLSL